MMNIIFFMIGVSLLMALGFLGAFFWSMSKGQNDDLHTPAMRILLDDEITVKQKNNLSTMKIQLTSLPKDEPKKCKCDKDCGRCKAKKEAILHPSNQHAK